MPERRIEHDSFLRCPKCKDKPYRLYRRQVELGSEVFQSVLWPNEQGVPPPANPSKIVCPSCDEELKRE